MINITANIDRTQTVYNFHRSSENNFRVGVDWEKSPGVRQGGYSVDFVEDQLELRDFRNRDNSWDVLVAPDGYESSVIVKSPSNGGRPGPTPPISRIDMPAPIKAEDVRKTALQVASALVGIPFMESMLSLPIEKA